MVSLNVARPMRPYGYDTFDALTGGVRPVENGLKRHPDGSLTVTFPDPPVQDPPLPPLVSAETLTAVWEWLSSRDDDDLAQRLALKAALIALRDQPPLPANPTTADRLMWLEQRAGLQDALLYPLARLFGMAPPH